MISGASGINGFFPSSEPFRFYHMDGRDQFCPVGFDILETAHVFGRNDAVRRAYSRVAGHDVCTAQSRRPLGRASVDCPDLFVGGVLGQYEKVFRIYADFEKIKRDLRF